MYLSRLRIDIGNDATREHPGRTWLRNLYHVHQRLCMAFPSASRKSDDPEFLKPFKWGDFCRGHVPARRDADSGFLFRVDPAPPGRAVILVQSARPPDWDYAFGLKPGLMDARGRPGGNAGYLLAAPPQLKPFDPRFNPGQRLRFRLVANPTKKIDSIRKEERVRLTKEQRAQVSGHNGRRVPVPSSEELAAWREKNPGEDERTFISLRLLDWLKSKAEFSGFAVENVVVQPGYAYFHKDHPPERDRQEQRRKDTGRRRSARYDGVLAVTDPPLFRETLIRGIGPGKAFGFGLLSLAPA